MEALGNYKIYRVDESYIRDIDFKMYKMIKHADIVFADLTSANPNVMYELGARHSLKSKQTIMFHTYNDNSEIPFDINHYVRYDTDIFENREKMMKILNNDKDDSPIIKSLSGKYDKTIFENISNKWNEFIEEFEPLRNGERFPELIPVISKYKKYLHEIESFDQKEALVTYKSYETKLDKFKDALEIIEKHQPLLSNDYETIGLYASITRKIYSLRPSEPNRQRANRIINYFLSKYHDAYSVSSYYMFFIEEYKYEKITKENLNYEFGKMMNIVERINNIGDLYLWDAQQTLKYLLGCVEKKDLKFHYPKSSMPVIEYWDKVKKNCSFTLKPR